MVLAALVVLLVPGRAAGEQASQPTSERAGQLEVGSIFSCALVAGRQLRCWGYGGDGELGYPGVSTVGTSDTPATAGPVDFGPGRSVVAVGSGDYHSCAILDDATVRCWGYGANGRLGYGDQSNVGDILTPAAAGPVDLGAGRTARAISAGEAHTCAILDDGSVRCWGFAADGQLGYGDTRNVGVLNKPGSVGPVYLGADRTAVAISSGGSHTCAILDNGSLLCWGYGGNGRLGYGSTNNVGDTSSTTPGLVGAVPLGTGRTAVAVTAGDTHTCAILDDGTVRCWGLGFSGQLGYGNQNNAGDTPATVPGRLPPVPLGGHRAVAISAGSSFTCAILDDGTVRCWGYGADGRLGSGNTNNAGDTPARTPDKLAPVDLGPGRTAVAISAGGSHVCARLDDGSVRCWGYGAYGQLGYCNTSNVGALDTPGAWGPVNLVPGDGGATCPPAPVGLSPPAISGAPGAGKPAPDPEALRAEGFRACLAAVAARVRHDRMLTHRGSARQRAAARRRLARRLGRGRARCINIYARTPGPVTGVEARTRGRSRIELDFNAPGTNGSNPPPARAYVIKESSRAIRTPRDYAAAPALCHSACRFNVTKVDDTIRLTIASLRPLTTYYFTIAALDNVTGIRGPRTRSVGTRTR